MEDFWNGKNTSNKQGTIATIALYRGDGRKVAIRHMNIEIYYSRLLIRSSTNYMKKYQGSIPCESSFNAIQR